MGKHPVESAAIRDINFSAKFQSHDRSAKVNTLYRRCARYFALAQPSPKDHPLQGHVSKDIAARLLDKLPSLFFNKWMEESRKILEQEIQLERANIRMKKRWAEMKGRFHELVRSFHIRSERM